MDTGQRSDLSPKCHYRGASNARRVVRFGFLGILALFVQDSNGQSKAPEPRPKPLPQTQSEKAEQLVPLKPIDEQTAVELALGFAFKRNKIPLRTRCSASPSGKGWVVVFGIEQFVGKDGNVISPFICGGSIVSIESNGASRCDNCLRPAGDKTETATALAKHVHGEALPVTGLTLDYASATAIAEHHLMSRGLMPTPTRTSVSRVGDGYLVTILPGKYVKPDYKQANYASYLSVLVDKNGDTKFFDLP